MDATVLEQPLQRELGYLSSDAVERREHDGLRCVVDDEVDTGQVLECPDVATLAADDPPLHVVGGKLDNGHRCLCGVTCCYPLQGVGHEVSRLAASLGVGFLVQLADSSRELMAHELFRSLEHLRLCIIEAQTRDPFELSLFLELRGLQLLLEIADVRLPIGQALVAPVELLASACYIGLGRTYLLLAFEHLCAPPVEVALGLTPHTRGVFLGCEL